MNLADSHCHLDDPQFAEDREGVIERAQAAGVRYMLSIGTGEGPPDLAAAVRLADRWSCVYATVGVHPNDATKKNETTFSDLVSLLAHPKVRAIGEIGLDYHWGVPKEVQVPVFMRTTFSGRQGKDARSDSHARRLERHVWKSCGANGCPRDSLA